MKTLAVLALLLPGVVFSQTVATVTPKATVTLSWNAVSQDTSGAPFAPGGYNVYVAGSAAALAAMPNTQAGGAKSIPVPITSLTVPSIVSVGNVTTWVTPPLPVGSYVMALTTWGWSPPGQTSNAVESALSSMVNVTVTAAVTPGAPFGVTVKCSAQSTAGIQVSCSM